MSEKTNLDGIGVCMAEEVFDLPELTLKNEINREYYKISIYSGSDGFEYWKVTGKYTDEYDKYMKVTERL